MQKKPICNTFLLYKFILIDDNDDDDDYDDYTLDSR